MAIEQPTGVAGRLNTAQVGRIVTTFAHVDTLLQTVERVSRADLSPFARERPDVAPDEARLLDAFVALARTRMLGALDRLAIPRPVPTVSARWSAQTSLQFADIALSDLTPGTLRGYGAVDAAAAAEVEALAADLRGVVARARQVLRDQAAGGLAARVAAVPGVAGEVLRAVERVSRERGLAEIRPLVDAAADRAGATTFDVGVFGRVSAGKSSLINALVGGSAATGGAEGGVLPVGATPVTAVPIRLSRGPSGAVLHLLDGTDRAIPADAIAEYATEERNPENRAGVRAIDVTAPGVPEGLRLLDTPGVGSLGASGPALAFAWLPRCDLGLVLVAAGSAVARDDLALVTGLGAAGIRCVVLVSKADLLAPAEADRALAYVRREIEAALGPGTAVDVRAISTAPGATATLDAFRHDVLAPLAREAARAAERALRERLHRLLRATAAAMTARGDAGRADGAGAPGVDDRTVRLQRARTEALTRIRREADRLDASASDVLAVAADAVATAWARGEDGRDAARTVIVRAAADALGAVRATVDTVRAGAGTGEPEARRVPPLFDPEFLDALPALAPPAVGRRLMAHRQAARRLAPIAEPLAGALQRYASRLLAWATGAVDELGARSWEAPNVSVDGALPPELAHLDAWLAESAGQPSGQSPRRTRAPQPA